ncbi:MAG: hypothetical protein VB858_01430 [Planctomycetaceae bacterium]
MKRLALQSMVLLWVTTCLLPSAQAGVIPWVYDVIFGPVRQPGYYGAVGYGPAYAQPAMYGYSPASRCLPCSSPVSATRAVSGCATGRCSTGGCPTTIAYYPAWPIGYTMVRSQCASACSTPSKADWRSSDTKNRQAPDSQTTYVKEKDPFIGTDKPPRPQPDPLPVTQVQPEPALVTAPAATGNGVTPVTGEGTAGEGTVIEQIKKDNWEETGKSDRPAEAVQTKEAPGKAVDSANRTDVVAPVRKDTDATHDAIAPAAETFTPLIKDEPAPVTGSEEAADGTGFGKNRRDKELPARLPDVETNNATDTKDGSSEPETGDTQTDEIVPLENEQDKTSWKFRQSIQRIVLRASFSNVRIARRSATVHPDGMAPAASLTQVAGR